MKIVNWPILINFLFKSKKVNQTNSLQSEYYCFNDYDSHLNLCYFLKKPQEVRIIMGQLIFTSNLLIYHTKNPVLRQNIGQLLMPTIVSTSMLAPKSKVFFYNERKNADADFNPKYRIRWLMKNQRIWVQELNSFHAETRYKSCSFWRLSLTYKI